MNQQQHNLLPPAVIEAPTVDYFQAATGTLGALIQQTPIVMASKKLRANRSSMGSLGAADGMEDLGALAMAMTIVGTVVGGVLFYQAGKAMAPTKAQGNTWGWIGVPVGLFTPWAIGLGIMGAISNAKK